CGGSSVSACAFLCCHRTGKLRGLRALEFENAGDKIGSRGAFAACPYFKGELDREAHGRNMGQGIAPRLISLEEQCAPETGRGDVDPRAAALRNSMSLARDGVD